MAGGERSAGVHTQAFDVNAKADDNPPVDVMNGMVKQLLADRFKLKIHTEPRDVDVYALVLGRTGGLVRTSRRRRSTAWQGPKN